MRIHHLPPPPSRRDRYRPPAVPPQRREPEEYVALGHKLMDRSRLLGGATLVAGAAWTAGITCLGGGLAANLQTAWMLGAPALIGLGAAALITRADAQIEFNEAKPGHQPDYYAVMGQVVTGLPKTLFCEF